MTEKGIMYDHPGQGALYIVSTPIGNLSDITVRALKVLMMVGLVASEDTRVTRALMNFHQIPTPLVSYHSYNQEEKIPLFLDRLKNGISIALVSDAGTPLISDPGSELVRRTIEAGFCVHPVPGPSSVLAALVSSGLEPGRFLFDGFLPRTPGEIRKRLERVQDYDGALVFLESPHRVLKTLLLMQEVLGDREASVHREMTKAFESVTRGALSEISVSLSKKPLKGEFTIVVAGKERERGRKRVNRYPRDVESSEISEKTGETDSLGEDDGLFDFELEGV
ncbi:MAG: 16S rRNA (cytidine(1402)-2'-O)-methyltransferase [Nitrospiraceae bacterium]|nr:16S rRNA (cytidine(1402)-2'-O)-methyltransferase [Nitrospiraceae bacterium]